MKPLKQDLNSLALPLSLILTPLFLNYQDLRKDFFPKLNLALFSAEVLPRSQRHQTVPQSLDREVKQPATPGHGQCGQHPSFLRAPKMVNAPDKQEAVLRTWHPYPCAT